MLACCSFDLFRRRGAVSFTHRGSGRFSGQHARGVRGTRYGLVSVFENNTIDIDYGYVEALGDGRVFE